MTSILRVYDVLCDEISDECDDYGDEINRLPCDAAQVATQGWGSHLIALCHFDAKSGIKAAICGVHQGQK